LISIKHKFSEYLFIPSVFNLYSCSHMFSVSFGMVYICFLLCIFSYFQSIMIFIGVHNFHSRFKWKYCFINYKNTQEKKLSNNFSLFFSLSSNIKGIFKLVSFSPQEQIFNVEQLTKQDDTFLFFSSRWLDLTHPWAMLAMVRLCLLTLTLPVVSKYYFSHLKDKTLHLDSVVP
jgi:hypothetical protein